MTHKVVDNGWNTLTHRYTHLITEQIYSVIQSIFSKPLTFVSAVKYLTFFSTRDLSFPLQVLGKQCVCVVCALCVCPCFALAQQKIWFKAHFLITVLARGNYNLRLRAVSLFFFYKPTEMQQFVVNVWDEHPPSHPLSLSHFPSVSHSLNTSLELV